MQVPCGVAAGPRLPAPWRLHRRGSGLFRSLQVGTGSANATVAIYTWWFCRHTLQDATRQDVIFPCPTSWLTRWPVLAFNMHMKN
ncbi:hypothetical protein VFPFJ_09743 [Purpureocillium lilacinum]|uniref:Uncharacterized protein n=1 Tax=Purpureocillium lilacinum TaxID=33203 RepID=A0A179GUW8_PURLI|nr:hypothetical protein VFPFJ_09743 [Purpureocillium lilacinum]OAQ81288.1 hypothetical protein VFPFJ_09743 [Purpureocillium lilacinum]